MASARTGWIVGRYDRDPAQLLEDTPRCVTGLTVGRPARTRSSPLMRLFGTLTSTDQARIRCTKSRGRVTPQRLCRWSASFQVWSGRARPSSMHGHGARVPVDGDGGAAGDGQCGLSGTDTTQGIPSSRDTRDTRLPGGLVKRVAVAEAESTRCPGTAHALGSVRNVIDVADLFEPLRRDPAAAEILVDFDGTQAPVVRDPAAAEPWAGVPELLDELARRQTIVVVVPGRPVAFLAARLPRSLLLAGVYGLRGATRQARGQFLVDAPAAEEVRQRQQPVVPESDHLSEGERSDGRFPDVGCVRQLFEDQGVP